MGEPEILTRLELQIMQAIWKLGESRTSSASSVE